MDLELSTEEIEVGTALLDSIITNCEPQLIEVQPDIPGFQDKETDGPQTENSTTIPDQPSQTLLHTPHIEIEPEPQKQTETPSSSTQMVARNDLLLVPFKVPEMPTARRTLLPTPTVQIIEITTRNTKMPLKITVKLDANQSNGSVLIDSAPAVGSFYMTVDSEEQFWKVHSFYTIVKVKAAQKVINTFPITLLTKSKVNFDLTYTKAIYKAHDGRPISVLNSDTIVGLQHLPRPCFLANPDFPAEIFSIFSIEIHSSYTHGAQEFLASAQRLGFNKTLEPLEIVSFLLAYFAKFKRTLTQDRTIYNTAPITNKRFRHI